MYTSQRIYFVPTETHARDMALRYMGANTLEDNEYPYIVQVYTTEAAQPVYDVTYDGIVELRIVVKR